jgi:hypothetical protein
VLPPHFFFIKLLFSQIFSQEKSQLLYDPCFRHALTESAGMKIFLKKIPVQSHHFPTNDFCFQTA